MLTHFITSLVHRSIYDLEKDPLELSIYFISLSQNTLPSLKFYDIHPLILTGLLKQCKKQNVEKLYQQHIIGLSSFNNFLHVGVSCQKQVITSIISFVVTARSFCDNGTFSYRQGTYLNCNFCIACSKAFCEFIEMPRVSRIRQVSQLYYFKRGLIVGLREADISKREISEELSNLYALCCITNNRENKKAENTE